MRTRDSLERRNRHLQIDSGDPLRLTRRDFLWAEKAHYHGPQPHSFFHAYTNDIFPSEKRLAKRFTRLNHDHIPGLGTPLFYRPPEQHSSIIGSTVHHIHTEPARFVLGERFSEYAPKPQWYQWHHDYATGLVTSSFDLAAKEQYALHHHQIVERIGKEKFNVKGKELKPDRFFAIDYPKGGIVYVIEMDMGTEPLTAKAKDRKTFEKTVDLYHEWIGKRTYYQDLWPGAKVMTLYVTIGDGRRDAMVEILKKKFGTCNYILVGSAPELGRLQEPPDPIYRFWTMNWLRAGTTPFVISNPS